MMYSLISRDSSYLGRAHVFCLRCDVVSNEGKDLFDSLMHTSSMLQWNLDWTKGQGTCKICSL